jgi:hypothetical protein
MAAGTVLMLVLLSFAAAQSFPRPALTLSGAYGYTHYYPDDLNAVNRIFEETSRSFGFKGYTVKPFNGHAEQMVGVGLLWRRVECSVESEVWREQFSQRDIHFTYNNLAGTVNADENYLFLPITLMFKYPIRLGRFLLLPGYGPGIMFGSATVNMSTVYYGTFPDDDLHLSFTSGFNLIHRFCLDAYYRFLPWVGAGVSAGYRFSIIPYLEVSKKEGYSYIFDRLFDGGAEVGRRLYLGHGNLNFVSEGDVRPFHQLVRGDMTGYYLWLKFIFIIGARK